MVEDIAENATLSEFAFCFPFFFFNKLQLIYFFVCARLFFPYLKYFSPATSRNFSMKSSESRTAICAARPIRAFAVGGRAWCTSYLTRLTPGADITGYRILCTISRYAAPGKIRQKFDFYLIIKWFYSIRFYLSILFILIKSEHENKMINTLIRRISYSSLAELDSSRVQGHVSILSAAAQQDVFELLQIALLA